MIPFGQGSIGYLTRSERAFCLWSTVHDVRGTVALEDIVMGNKSFMACRVCDVSEVNKDSGIGMIASSSLYMRRLVIKVKKQVRILFSNFHRIIQEL